MAACATTTALEAATGPGKAALRQMLQLPCAACMHVPAAKPATKCIDQLAAVPTCGSMPSAYCR